MGDKANSNTRQRASIMPHRKLRSDFDGKIAGLYDLEETIGEGHFAVVKLARHVFTGEKVAVKVIDKTKLDDISKAHLFQEVRCMKLVQHPNVVRLYEVIDTQTKLYLILELGDGGDMYDYIMKHEKGIEENKARLYFRQIVEAISYCHRLHVVHRDLKPENVVFFKKLELVKLTDFGFSNMFNPGNKLETSCGSLAYSAPEILLGDSYDAQAVDIWSLGVILFMLVCGKPPFQEVNDSETLTMIMDCKYQFPPHVSQSCRELVSLMLRKEPGHRATLQQIEEHAWLKTGADDIPHFHMPLISRENVTEEVHVNVVDKMVEGCIATKEEILQSIEKDMYNHITATYYLLAERRLRKHRQEMDNQAALLQLRKNSAPPGSHPKPHLEPLALSPRIQSKDAESADEKKLVPKQKGLVMSLLSPQGIHPTPSTSLCDSPIGRKCSLIKEESVDSDSCRSDDEDLEIESFTDKIRSSKSAENLDFDDDRSNNASPNKEPEQQQVFIKRPLLSVASSPQLLNQICEENESEEEDDFVPPNLSNRMLTKRNSVASPEVIRKYEARRRRKGTGSRGTSCSSSDASDTDDTEGRSRKDKLKHKFVHRRDSSDHSSDTDGGPSGHGGGGFGKGLGGGGEGGGGPRRDGDDKGGGGGKKDGKGGSPRNGRNHHHSKGKQNNLSFKLGGEPILENIRTSELSVGSSVSNRSLAGSRSSLKYVIERDENVSDSDAEDNADIENDEGVSEIKKLRETLIEKLNQENKTRGRKHGTTINDFSSLNGDSKTDIKKLIIARCPPNCDINGGKKSNSPLKLKMDINSNMCCKQQSCQQNTQIKVETKCCSLV
ncbi:SNF-related serine/threonine-protein kinase-like isoform X5 [Ruditapes philippinarum]|uniref:SNF-related serine/threonine-protein kinase-like isoform X5 n=1 Tax=Ruditapes philippinarum TaxID=129788 RepID=UPI00295C1A72|nr:SNF-related serine/threonine-protein kinase-like isoform X5 [Ruditapes philippinarum]